MIFKFKTFNHILKENLEPLNNVSNMDDALEVIRNPKNTAKVKSALEKIFFSLNSKREPTQNKEYYKFILPLVASILTYNSIDPRANSFINALNSLGSGISNVDDNWALALQEALEKADLDNSTINEFLKPDNGFTSIKSKDLSYIINLISILKDNYKVKKFKDSNGNTPKTELLFDNKGNFKQIPEIKRIMDSFIDNDNKNNYISLKKYLIDTKWDANKIKQSLLNKDVIEQLPSKHFSNEDKNILINLIDTISQGTQDAKKHSSAMQRDVEVNPSWSAEKKETISLILNQILKWLKEYDGLDFTDTNLIPLNSYLESNNIKHVKDKISYLYNIVSKNSSLTSSELLQIKSKLNQLLYSKNSGILDILLDTKIDSTNIQNIAQKIISFINDAIKQNYLYTTIREALALSGIDNPEVAGKNFLKSKLLNLKSPEQRANYSNKLDNVYKNTDLIKSLLNQKITKSGKSFKWVDAIVTFLDNINTD